MYALAAAVIAAVCALIQGVTVALINKGHKSDEASRAAAAEKRAKDAENRVKRDECVYALLFAEANGIEILLRAAHGEHINGNVESALKAIENAKDKCNSEFNHQVASAGE